MTSATSADEVADAAHDRRILDGPLYRSRGFRHVPISRAADTSRCTGFRYLQRIRRFSLERVRRAMARACSGRISQRSSPRASDTHYTRAPLLSLSSASMTAARRWPGHKRAALGLGATVTALICYLRVQFTSGIWHAPQESFLRRLRVLVALTGGCRRVHGHLCELFYARCSAEEKFAVAPEGTAPWNGVHSKPLVRVLPALL